MVAQAPRIETVDGGTAKQSWDELVRRVADHETRTIIDVAGQPPVVMLAVDDFERLLRWEAERTADFAIIDEMQAVFADVPDAELEREIERALANVRAAAAATSSGDQTTHPE